MGLHLLAEYGALQLLNYPTLTTAILQQYATAFNGPQATLLAAVLVGFCLGLLGLELLLRRHRVHSRVGPGANRPAERIDLGRRRPLVVAVLLGLSALSLGVPLASLARWLIRGSSTAVDLGELTSATTTTLSLAFVSGLVSTAAALPVAWLAVRHRGGWPHWSSEAPIRPAPCPASWSRWPWSPSRSERCRGIYQTLPLLVLGYVILFLPRALVSVRSTLEPGAPGARDVARSLGGTGPRAAARVVPADPPGAGAQL